MHKELNTVERLCKEGMEQLKDRTVGGKQLRWMVLVFTQEAKQFLVDRKSKMRLDFSSL